MNQINGMRWLIGVTSTQTTAAGGVDMRQWLQDKLGHVFLAAYDQYRGSNLIVGAQQFVGGTVTHRSSGDIPETRLRYEGASLQLKFSNFCIRDNGFGNVQSANCDANDLRQKWIYTNSSGRLQNIGSGQCLDQGIAVISTPCQGTSGQRWLFLTDDDPLAAGL
jgi:hypothetical protein